MKEMLSIISAAAFVYLALGIQARGGDVWYYVLVAIALIGGYLIRQ
jgi:hypothetical protein